MFIRSQPACVCVLAPPDALHAKIMQGYVVRALEFSPDSLKLAVAQSDNIVFVYVVRLEEMVPVF